MTKPAVQLPNTEKFWAGSEESLAQYMQVLQVLATRPPMEADMYGSQNGQGNEEELPRLLQMAGDVGVVTIAGPLVNTDSPYNKYYGITGYPEIRAALVHAASDPNVGAIVLDINSGGGAVSGVSDTADLIDQIDKEIKPVYTFSDGQIASAAYWLGSAAREMSIGKVTEAGSIGVLTVHKEISKMLQDAGINATVMRAGEFKALGNMYEPLTDKAKTEIQGQLEQMYQMFVQHVADARGVTYPVADQKLGQGRVFMGAAAVDIGLVDGISSFDAVISKAQRGIDSKNPSSQYGANSLKGPGVKHALTQQQVAAIAAAGGNVVTAEATQAAGAAGGSASVTSPEAEAPAAEAAAPAAPAAEAAAPAAPAAPAAAEGSNEIVAFLKGELASAQAANTALTIELRDLKASSAEMIANHGALRAIANAAVDNLRVALGGTAGAEALADTALLAEHANLRGQFEAKFKVGGVATASAAAASDKAVAVDDPIRQARIQSTRPGK